jgi:glycerol-3-phosphate dehydrogenase
VSDVHVVVIGGGVVGVAVAHALARRGVDSLVLEAEEALGSKASATNSGILHTGFDSTPGELETRLILRSAELRDELELGVPVVRCGAELAPRSDDEHAAVRQIAGGAMRNGVDVRLRDDGALEVPGEAITDPVGYVRALAEGIEVRLCARVAGIEAGGDIVVHTADGERVSARLAVNCAGLFADEVARLAGDDSFEIYPRKGEFFVFEPPGAQALERILLPVPTKRTKGVLVFPTIDGKVVAGPTAHDQDDKEDWSVRADAREEVMGKAAELLPELEGVEPIWSYAGLRPAGRDVNYAIGPSAACPGLINVAAIRSTGLSASLGISERVAVLVAEQGVELGPERGLRVGSPPAPDRPWWRRTAEFIAGVP